MAVAFLRGTTTGPSDLSITARDINNNLIDPYQLFYAIYDFTTGIEVLMGSPTNTPARASIGQYYAQLIVPADGNIGVWRIRWTIQEVPTDPVYQSVQEFQIVGSSIIPVSFSGDVNTDGLIYSLRTFLRDNNPDKNYRFRAPSSEKFIQGQTQVFGFIWEDEELYEYLLWAVDDFNSRPPTTGINLANLGSSERRWRTTILIRAAAFACMAIAMNWIADEFSVHQDERLTVQDKNGDEYSVTIKELFDIIYEDRLNEITVQAKKEILESIQELKNEYS
jgi:hypothetical protein